MSSKCSQKLLRHLDSSSSRSEMLPDFMLSRSRRFRDEYALIVFDEVDGVLDLDLPLLDVEGIHDFDPSLLGTVDILDLDNENDLS